MGKKLSSAEKAERRKRRNSLIIGLVLIVLMIFGTLGAFYGGGGTISADSTPGFEFEGQQFDIQTDQSGNSFYVTEISGSQVAFYSTPYEVRALDIDDLFWQDYFASGTIIFTSEPLPEEGSIPMFQQYLNLVTGDLSASISKNFVRGYLEKDFFNEGSVYTCDDAGDGSLVLVYRGEPNNSTLAGIYPSNTEKCYDLVATPANLILLRDYVVYVNWGVLSG